MRVSHAKAKWNRTLHLLEPAPNASLSNKNYCSKQRIAKLQVKETDEDPIIPAIAFTEVIESIVQHPITDSDADLQIENELLEASSFSCIIINDVISSVNLE